MARSSSKTRGKQAEAGVNGDSPAAPAVSPLRRQYLEVKARHPDAIVLFRLGDFYETFDEDARTAAAELDIVLTGRDMGKGQRVPMAGVPAHSLEGYLARLIRRGFKVAICEQVSDPAAGAGLVERDVVRIVTPGTVVEPGLLDERANNFIAAVALQGDLAGLAYADITTAEFATAQVPLLTLPLELERLGPAELLVPEELDAASILGALKPPAGDDGGPAVTLSRDANFRLATARRTLLEHFGVTSLEAYGCEGMPLAVRAAGALLAYLQDTQKGNVGQITALRTYSPERYMVLDYQTRRNPGALPRGALRGRDGAARRARLHEDAHGRSPAAAVAGAAPPRPRGVGAPAGRRGVVPREQHQAGEHCGAARRDERPRAAGQPGDRGQRDAP